MNAPPTPDPQPVDLPRRRFPWKHVFAITGGVLALIAICVVLLAWFANSAQFQDRVRRKVIATIEQATGGHVELKSFRWRLLHLELEADDLTVHGLEGPGEIPYAHVDKLRIRAKILAFLQPKIGLNLLVAEHPVFHLIIYPDGSTNQPRPKVVSAPGKPIKDTLFDLAVDRTEIADGWVIVNQKKIPFDLAAKDLGATVAYVPAANGKDRYIANVTVADLTAHRGKEPPIRSNLDLNLELGRNSAQLNALHLKTGPSLLEASGGIEDFANPQWHFAMTGKIDVREVESLTEVEGLGGGIATLRLKGQGGRSKFVVEGDTNVQGATYATPYVTVRGANATTRIHATEEELLLTDAVATLDHEGEVQGSLRLSHWLGTASPAVEDKSASPRNGHAVSAPSKPQPMTGTIRARLSGITLREILKATAARRYQDLGFDTAVSGPVEVDWVGGGDDLTLKAKMTMMPTRSAAKGEVPVSGMVDAEYFNRHGTVEIQALEAQTPGTHLSVKGSLGVYPESRTSALQGDLVTKNLGEFDRTLNALGLVANGKHGVQALPVELQGQAEFHGQVTGTIYEPIVKGHVVATNFATVLPAPAASGSTPARATSGPAALLGTATTAPPAAPAGQQKIQWDRLDATGEYSLEQISIQQATIARGHTVVHATGSIRPHRLSPHHVNFDEQSAINATLGVQDADVTDVLAIAGQQQVPVTGKLTMDVHAGGTLNNLNGGGHLSVKGGEIYEEPYRSLNADLGFAGRELAIRKLTFSQNGGTITGDAAYDLGSKRFRADAKGQGFELSHFRRIQRQNLGLTGKLTFEAHGSGAIDNPTIHANAHLADVLLDNQKLGTLDADAHAEHGSLFYTANSQLAGAQMRINGQTELRDGYMTQAKLVFTGLDIDPILRFAKIQGLTAHSSIQGQATVSGPLKEPRRLNGELSASQFAVSLAGVPLASDGPIHAALKNGILTLDPLHITGEDTNLRAQGSMSVLANGEMKLHGDGAVNLKLAQTLNPDIASSGRVDFVVDARGTLDRPDLSGQVRFTNGVVTLQDLPNGLSQINGTLQFNQDRLDVKSLTAQTGGGQLKIGGYITYQQGLYGDLTASGKNIRMRYPTGVSSMGDANLRLQGSQKDLLLSGNILITRFAINPNLDISGLVGSATSVAPPLDPNAPSNHVRLDIHITSAPALNFQNSFAKLAGDVDLRVRGTVASPSVLGRVNVTEGSANFAGTQYQLQHGDIYFTNPVRIDPTIDLDATARVENYDITIGLHGTANKLNVTYRSEPPLAQSDVIALLALGRTQEEQSMFTQQQQNAGTNSTTNALLGGALNATVSNRVQKLFGVGSVKIDPTFVGSLGNSTARITVEQQVSRNVTLTYATNVNSTAQQLIQAQIGITRNVSLVAVRDENGVFSMVVKVHRRYR
ncbi:MAG TPA: translocation/assembly module TamB domain-containing protein [Acidisarcina sp.]|nr:translocation/assembly module TamB domain-containing protein [Acidisarcina sp.]